MKKDFIGKVVSFFGDSITGHGQYIYYLRSFFHESKEKCCVFNRGIGGNRSVHAEYVLEKDVISDRPDFVFISFGVNDVGIWLYDCDLAQTENVLSEKKQRDEAFYKGIDYTISKLTENGITPVLMTPFAVNSEIEKDSDIRTLTDNEEKRGMKPSFYKRETFGNINAALKNYSDGLKEIAKERGIGICDAFEKTYALSKNVSGLFLKDGIHYSEKGGREIAKIILDFMGVKDIPNEFKTFEENEEIFKLEKRERGVQAALSLKYKFKEIEKSEPLFTEQMKRFSAEKNGDEYFVNTAKMYLENVDDYEKNRERVKTLTFDL